METKTHVLVADGNQDFCKMLTEKMGKERDLELVGCTGDGAEAYALAKQLQPDLIMLDLVLPRLDGLEMLCRLREEGCEAHVIVLTSFVTGDVVARCASSGADYFIYKPCDPMALIKHIRQIAGGIEPPVEVAGIDCQNLRLQHPSELDLETLVTEIIHEIGVPAHIKGYQYLREAIILTIKDMDMINAVT